LAENALMHVKLGFVFVLKYLYHANANKFKQLQNDDEVFHFMRLDEGATIILLP
jgi:uncharacterized membrane protein